MTNTIGSTVRSRTRSPGLLGLDLISVGVFAAVGRRSHAEGLSLIGIANVAAPFAAAAVTGWALSKAWRTPTDVVPTGVIVWGTTLTGGMTLRYVFGGGVQPTFVLVAGTFLGVTLLGWRAVANRV